MNLSHAHTKLIIRTVGGSDEQALRRLAERDSARVPTGPVLAGERDGEMIAAVSLSSGEAIADPFVASAGALESVRREAAEIEGWTTTDRRRHRRGATRQGSAFGFRSTGTGRRIAPL